MCCLIFRSLALIARGIRRYMLRKLSRTHLNSMNKYFCAEARPVYFVTAYRRRKKAKWRNANLPINPRSYLSHFAVKTQLGCSLLTLKRYRLLRAEKNQLRVRNIICGYFVYREKVCITTGDVAQCFRDERKLF